MSYSLVDPVLNKALISYTEVFHLCWFSSSWNDSCSSLNDYHVLILLIWITFIEKNTEMSQALTGRSGVVSWKSFVVMNEALSYSLSDLQTSDIHWKAECIDVGRKTWLFYDWWMKTAKLKKMQVKGSLVPRLLCSVGGQTTQLVLCVSADNYPMLLQRAVSTVQANKKWAHCYL